MTFKEYLDKILRPMVVASIALGRFDNMLDDTMLDDIYKNEPDILKSIYMRRRWLQNNYA